MSCYASFMFLFLFSFLSSFRASAQIPNPSILRYGCSNTTYSRNSTYFTNLRNVMSSLSSRASYSTRFQNATAGQGPDRVTGLFLCRGDQSPEVCRNCVAFAINDTLTRCPNQTETIIYYDQCMLRYANRNILFALNTVVGVRMRNPHKVASNQLDGFRDLASSTLNQAAAEAASIPTKFAARKAQVPGLQPLYGLVQCTPDLTRETCLSCLQQSIPQLDTESVGGRIFTPSCTTRYEVFSFYNESAISSQPPISSPPLIAPPPSGKRGNTNVLVVGIVVPIIVVLLIAGYHIFVTRAKKTAPTFDGDDITTIQSLQLDYKTIQAATNDFSEDNKIGQGGFGEVFKGTFLNGTDVAVKRLSKTSGQGETEFKNEVVVVAKLQHKNLVRLLGFSLEGEERILVYEYVPNESLDYFLFDHTKRGQLDWTRRHQIIGGIARGILYLHQDSRLTVIHRDLKASNILLDADMNPKIADFGMARIFGMDQTQENTSRIVGTHGYMPPEYLWRGQFSMKSDVYSFGVLVLELISGRKNSKFSGTDNANDLLTYAYMLWRNGRALDFVDPIILNNCWSSEILRYIHIGLLCVQEDPIERPTLSTISVMLTSNTVTLPMPQKPGFFVQSNPEIDPFDADQSTTTKSVVASAKSTSGTDLYPPEYEY